MKHLILLAAGWLLCSVHIFGQACDEFTAGYRFIDFDNQCEGKVITSSVDVAGPNIHFSTVNSTGQSHPIVIFNSADPTGGDNDLVSPGPGPNNNSSGWHPQETGSDLGFIIILETTSNQGGSCQGEPQEGNPNDWAIPNGQTGTFVIEFDVPHVVASMGFLDDLNDTEVYAYQNNSNTPFFSTTLPNTAENEYYLHNFSGLSSISKLEIVFKGSGAITHLEVCEQAGIFPLELTSFTATPLEEGVALDWATASELHSEYFEIQRSLDGAQFSTIATQQALGGVSQGHEYHMMDYAAAESDELYYRILQHNFDGTIDISPIQRVALQLEAVQIFPNPATHMIQLQHASPIQEVRLVNMQGQLMVRQPGFGTMVEIGLGHLPSGIYTVEIEGEDQKVIRRRMQKM